MSNLHIYHNPRCSKSRETLKLLEDKGHKPEIIEYLKFPPTCAELANIIKMLGFTSARELMRKKESEYQELNLSDPGLSEMQLAQAMSDHPKLIERPIVINNQKARIGRPPEAVLELF
jgi:arsenate reductase